MAQQQRQHYGRQTDEHGNQIRQTDEHGNPVKSGGGQLRTAGYGGEHGTTGGGYRGTQYGSTDIGGGTQYGASDGSTQHKTTDVGSGGVVGGYSTIEATGSGAGIGSGGEGHELGLRGGDQYGSRIGTGGDHGREHQEGEKIGVVHNKGHDDQPVVVTTTHTIVTGITYEQEAHQAQDEEKKGLIDKILDKVPGLH